MNKTITLSFVLLLTLAPLTGCIENMQDLKERLGAETPAAAAEPEPVKKATTNDTTPQVNTTPKATKAPVARITVFGANGALVYKSSFQADDEADPIYTTAPATLKLIATDSQVLEPGAKLDTYTWTFAGMTMEGAQMSHELTEPGMYPLTLTVTDTKGGKDMQNITLAVAPEPFEVVTQAVTSQVAGAEKEGVSGSATFELASSLEEGKTFTIQSMKVKTAMPPTCVDVVLEIIGPDGETKATVDDEFNADEEASLTSPAEGAYTINVLPFTCVAPEGVPLTITVTYMQVIDGLETGDGHGHAH